MQIRTVNFFLSNLHALSSFSLYWNGYNFQWGTPGGTVVKSPPANAGDARDMGSISESGRFPGGGSDNPLHYSCLENSMDRGTWWATDHGVAKGQTGLRTHTCLSLFQYDLFYLWRNTYVVQGLEFLLPCGIFPRKQVYMIVQNSSQEPANFPLLR